MKKWKKILLSLFVIGLVGGGIIFWYVDTKKPADIRKMEANFEITSTKLVADFNANEDSANKKYLDKVIAVSGKISDIAVDSSKATVILESGDPMAAVTCSFYDDEASKVKQLQKGTPVIIKGNCTGKLMDVVLNKCSITKN